MLKLISIYLLFSIGLSGGRELAQAPLGEVAGLLTAGVALTIAIPTVTYLVVRRLGGLDIANAAAIAANYGSVSSVTFFAALSFARAMNAPAEGYITAVVLGHGRRLRRAHDRTFGGRCLRAGCDLREQFLHRRPCGLPGGIAGGEPGHLSDRLARRDLSLQPAHRFASMLADRAVAGWWLAQDPSCRIDFALYK